MIFSSITPVDAGTVYELSVAGAFVMLISVGFVTGLLSWCIWKVLTTPGSEEHIHSPVDIDPHDRD